MRECCTVERWLQEGVRLRGEVVWLEEHLEQEQEQEEDIGSAEHGSFDRQQQLMDVDQNILEVVQEDLAKQQEIADEGQEIIEEGKRIIDEGKEILDGEEDIKDGEEEILDELEDLEEGQKRIRDRIHRINSWEEVRQWKGKIERKEAGYGEMSGEEWKAEKSHKRRKYKR